MITKLIEIAWNDAKYIDDREDQEAKQDQLSDKKLAPLRSDEFDNHEKTLTEDHKKATKKYIRSSVTTNTSLRKKSYNRLDMDHVKALDHVTSGKLPRDASLYRGNSAKMHLPVGTEFTDHGYTSTSTDTGTAKFFSEDSNHIFKIHAKKGHMGHLLEDNPIEKEVLLHRGTRFKVLGHTHDDKDGLHITHLGIVHQRAKKLY